MGFTFAGAIGPQYIADGIQPNLGLRATRDGSLALQETHGKYAEAASRGLVFHGVVGTAGIALIVSATTGNHPSLWNYQGSGYNAEVASLELGWISGAVAPTAIYFMLTANAGSQLGTAAPVVTFTQVATVNGLTNGAADAIMKWAPAINTYAAPPAFWKGTGIGLGTGAPTVTPSVIVFDYDGKIVLAPGNVLSLTSQAATTTALYSVDLTYVLARV